MSLNLFTHYNAKEQEILFSLLFSRKIYLFSLRLLSASRELNNFYVGTWGDINAWSFCQDKIITTGGEGGMVTTNSLKLFKKAWSLKDHGKGYDTVFNKEHPSGFRWLHENIGTNWRMMPIQAVIGIHALDELENWVQKDPLAKIAILLDVKRRNKIEESIEQDIKEFILQIKTCNFALVGAWRGGVEPGRPRRS